MEVQVVRGHLRASVGVLLSPRWMDKPEAEVRAGDVEKVDQGVAPPGLIGGPLSPLFAAAVVEVLIGALVETPPHRCWPSLLSEKEWCGPWCPCHHVVFGTVRRHVSWCRSLAVRSVTTLPAGDCSCTWAALRHGMGWQSPTPRARARGMRWTQSGPARLVNSGTGGRTSGQMPWALAIFQNILVISARTKAERW